MANIREATAVWKGDLMSGEGIISFGSKALEGPYSFKARTAEQQGKQTNPEELIGAAHSGCFTMALAAELTKAGFPPDTINTVAKVHLDVKPGNIAISQIDLETKAKIPGITADKFQEIAKGAKENCPVSKALAAVKITLNAALE